MGATDWPICSFILSNERAAVDQCEAAGPAVCLKVECVCVCVDTVESVGLVRRLQGLFLFKLVGAVRGRPHLSTNQRVSLPLVGR